MKEGVGTPFTAEDRIVNPVGSSTPLSPEYACRVVESVESLDTPPRGGRLPEDAIPPPETRA